MTNIKSRKKLNLRNMVLEVRTTVNEQLNTFVSGLRGATQPQASECCQTVSSL